MKMTEPSTPLTQPPTVSVPPRSEKKKEEKLKKERKERREKERQEKERERVRKKRRLNRPNTTAFVYREWKRQVPAKSKVQFVPGKQFVKDPDGRFWARQSWVVGYPELRWAEENMWFCWSRDVPDVVRLGGKVYSTEVYRLKWAKKAAVKLIEI